MNKNKYYSIMCAMGEGDKTDFETLHKIWYSCFEYFLKRKGFNKKSIKELFYGFEMSNWKAMHKENTEYKDYTKEQFITAFCAECNYISDRMSYDRLFRAHWLFRQAFEEELVEKKFNK
jgi:hypothetical protein